MEISPPGGLVLECGEILDTVTIAYETYGELNRERTNAVLVVHALSGDAQRGGLSSRRQETGMVGRHDRSRKGFDTDKYFVICSNILGGCKGTTGP